MPVVRAFGVQLATVASIFLFLGIKDATGRNARSTNSELSIGLGQSATQGFKKLVFAPYLGTIVWKNQGTRKVVSQIFLKPIDDGDGKPTDNVLTNADFVDWLSHSSGGMTTVSAVEEGSAQYNSMFGPSKYFDVKSWIGNIPNSCPCLGSNLVQMLEQVDKTPKGRIQTIFMAWKSAGLPAVTIFRIKYPLKGKPLIGMTQIGFVDEQKPVGVKISASFVIKKGREQTFKKFLSNSPLSFIKANVNSSLLPPWNMVWKKFTLYVDQTKPALTTPICITLQGNEPDENFAFVLTPKLEKSDLNQAPVDLPDEFDYTVKIFRKEMQKPDKRHKTGYFAVVIFDVMTIGGAAVEYVSEVVLLPSNLVTLGTSTDGAKAVLSLLKEAGISQSYFAAVIQRGTKEYLNIFYSISLFKMKAWVESLKAALAKKSPTWTEVSEEKGGQKKWKVSVTWSSKRSSHITVNCSNDADPQFDVSIHMDYSADLCKLPAVTVKKLLTDQGDAPYFISLNQVIPQCGTNNVKSTYDPPLLATIIYDVSRISQRKFVTQVVLAPLDENVALKPPRAFVRLVQADSQVFKTTFLKDKFEISNWVAIAHDPKGVASIVEVFTRELGGNLHTIKISWDKVSNKVPAYKTIISIFYPDDKSSPQIHIFDVDPDNLGQDSPAEIVVYTIQVELTTAIQRCVPKEVGPRELTMAQILKLLYPTANTWTVKLPTVFLRPKTDYFVTVLFDVKYGDTLQYPTRIVLTPLPGNFQPTENFLYSRLVKENSPEAIKTFCPEEVNFNAWKENPEPGKPGPGSTNIPFYSERLIEREEGKLQIIRIFWTSTDGGGNPGGGRNYYTVIYIFYPSKAGKMPQVLAVNVDPDEDDYELDLVVLLVPLGKHRPDKATVCTTTVIKQVMAKEVNVGFKLVATTAVTIHNESMVPYQQVLPGTQLEYVVTLLYKIDLLRQRPQLCKVILIPKEVVGHLTRDKVKSYSRIIGLDSATYKKVFSDESFAFQEWIKLDPTQSDGPGKVVIQEIVTMKEYGKLQTIKIFWDGKKEPLNQLVRKYTTLVHIFYPCERAAKPSISITTIEPDDQFAYPSNIPTAIIQPSLPGSILNILQGMVDENKIPKDKPWDFEAVVSSSTSTVINDTVSWVEEFIKPKLPKLVTLTYEKDPTTNQLRIAAVILHSVPAKLDSILSREFCFTKMILKDSAVFKDIFKSRFDVNAWLKLLPSKANQAPRICEDIVPFEGGHILVITVLWNSPTDARPDVTYIYIYFPSVGEPSIKIVRVQPNAEKETTRPTLPEIPVFEIIGDQAWLCPIPPVFTPNFPTIRLTDTVVGMVSINKTIKFQYENIVITTRDKKPGIQYVSVIYKIEPNKVGQLQKLILAEAVALPIAPSGKFTYSRLIEDNSDDFDKVFSKGSFSSSDWLKLNPGSGKNYPSIKETITKKADFHLQIITVSWSLTQKTVIMVTYKRSKPQPSVKIFQVDHKKTQPDTSIPIVLISNQQQVSSTTTTTEFTKKEEIWESFNFTSTVSNFTEQHRDVTVVYEDGNSMVPHFILLLYDQPSAGCHDKVVTDIIMIPVPEKYELDKKESYSKVLSSENPMLEKVFSPNGFVLANWKTLFQLKSPNGARDEPQITEVISKRNKGVAHWIHIDWRTDGRKTLVFIYYQSDGTVQLLIQESNSGGGLTKGEVNVKLLLKPTADTKVVISSLPRQICLVQETWDFTAMLKLMVEMKQDELLPYKVVFREKIQPWRKIKYLVTIVYTTGLQFKRAVKDIVLFPSPYFSGKNDGKTDLKKFVYSRILGYDTSSYKKIFDASSLCFSFDHWLQLTSGTPGYSTTPEPNFLEEIIVKQMGTLQIIRIYWDGVIDGASAIQTKYKTIIYLFYPADGSDPTSATIDVDPNAAANDARIPSSIDSFNKSTSIRPIKQGDGYSPFDVAYKIIYPDRKVNSIMITDIPTLVYLSDIQWEFGIIVSMLKPIASMTWTTFEYAFAIQPPVQVTQEDKEELEKNPDAGWQYDPHVWFNKTIRERPIKLVPSINSTKPYWEYITRPDLSKEVCAFCFTGLPKPKPIGGILRQKIVVTIVTKDKLIPNPSKIVEGVLGNAQDLLSKILGTANGGANLKQCSGGTKICSTGGLNFKLNMTLATREKKEQGNLHQQGIGIGLGLGSLLG